MPPKNSGDKSAGAAGSQKDHLAGMTISGAQMQPMASETAGKGRATEKSSNIVTSTDDAAGGASSSKGVATVLPPATPWTPSPAPRMETPSSPIANSTGSPSPSASGPNTPGSPAKKSRSENKAVVLVNLADNLLTLDSFSCSSRVTCREL